MASYSENGTINPMKNDECSCSDKEYCFIIKDQAAFYRELEDEGDPADDTTAIEARIILARKARAGQKNGAKKSRGRARNLRDVERV